MRNFLKYLTARLTTTMSLAGLLKLTLLGYELHRVSGRARKMLIRKLRGK